MKIKRILSCCTALGMLFSAVPTLSVAEDSLPDNGILINEVCTQNKTCLRDSYGSTSDWIELYNPTDNDIPLAGYSITKAAENPKTWEFPEDAVIGAGKYLIVFASKDETFADEYHTGFNLSKNGVTLTLKAPDGSVIQELTVPTLGNDMSYGITQTGAAEIMTATPGKPNVLTVSAPSFSKASGFYDEEFQLELSASDGDTIYYTIDGSDPLTSKTAQIYDGSFTVKDRTAELNIYRNYGEERNDPQSICVGMNYKAPCVSVEKAMVVRAAAKDADGNFSAPVQQTYFITDGTLADFTDTMVVSLVTDPDNLFSPDTGIYVVGNKWKWNESEAWNVDTNPNNMRNYHRKGKEWEREANITIFDSGENIVEQSMGIRIKGSSSRNNPQKSFNLYARSDYGASKVEHPLFPENRDVNGDVITEYDSLTLRSSGALHDSLVHAFMKDRNITMTAQRPCVLFINGEYWGMYQLTEKFSDSFIKSHYGASKSDVAIVKNGNVDEGNEYDLSEFNSLVSKYASRDLSKDYNYEEACRYFDVESLIEHYAAGIYYGTWDWPDYNYGAWKDKGVDSDGKWHFLAFDFDPSISRTYENVNQELYTVDFFSRVERNGGYTPTKLFLSMLNNDDFRMKFARAFKEYAEQDTLSTFYEMKDAVVEEIIRSRFYLWNSEYTAEYSDPENACRREVLETMDNIEKYLKKRPAYALDQMKKHLGIDPNDIPDEPDPYTIADLVLLQKYILRSGELPETERYDLCEDGIIDAFDLAVLRRTLIENPN